MRTEVAVTVNLECAHRDDRGRLHGHSYLVEIWRPSGCDLPAFAAVVTTLSAELDHTLLEDSLGDPTMEAIGAWFLRAVPQATRIVVRRPTLGYAAEVRRQ